MDALPKRAVATTERAERRVTRFRPSVRVLMVVVALVAVLLGWYVNAVRSQLSAVAAIKKAGGSVSYDWNWGNYDPNIVPYHGKWRAPKWLSSWIGPDYVASVVHVDLVAGRGTKEKADDLTLKFVGRLTHVESLWLDGTSVTDAGMVHVNRLTRLNNLTLGCPGVTDAGLARLTGLTNLKLLYLDGSNVTDAGVLALEEALPRVQVLRRDELAVGRNSTRATNDLAFATSLPVRVAAPVLLNRARTMRTRGDTPELVASIDALCRLESDNVVDLIKLAQARGECLGILQPSFSPKLSASERQALLKQCEDRGIDALRLAVDKGYNNIRRLDGDLQESQMVGNLRNHPGYARLIQIMKARRKGANR